MNVLKKLGLVRTHPAPYVPVVLRTLRGPHTPLEEGTSWYLAGPMRGHPEFNFPAFYRAAYHLRHHFHLVVWSPAENSREEEFARMSKGYDPSTGSPGDGGGRDALSFFMEVDLAQVARADGVIVLPGWQESEGAVLEVLVALYLGKPVIRYDSWTRVERVRPTHRLRGVINYYSKAEVQNAAGL